MMISWSGFHQMVSHACIGEQKAIAFCEAVNYEQSEQEGKFLFCDAGFHFMITPPEKAFWFHMIFYYT